MVKHLYIIAGCNGAGKTTASMTILPKSLLVKEFVNADEIAKGLSPFNPEGVAIEAGRLMLDRIKYLLDKEESFSVETTLATRSYMNLVKDARKRGYLVNIIYFWLESPELAIDRVAERVSKGGHNIPQDVILRRYSKGLYNLFNLFTKEVDVWAIYDNSEYKRERIAFGGRNIKLVVNLKSATKPFNVLLACTRPLITELSDKLRLIHPLLPTTSPYPTMRLEAIRSIIPISCRRHPKSV